MDLGIKNKIALVTGGASGIGKAIATDLALEGATVIITSRSDEKLNDALADLKKINNKCVGFKCELTKDNSPTELVDLVMNQFGSIDIVVNNVGATLGILDPLCPLDDWYDLFKLIMGVAIEINNKVIPVMKKNKWGRIVNITAGASMENSGPVPYSSLKAAYTAYSRSMARVLALEKTGIVMSAVLPGVVITEDGHWTSSNANSEHAKKYLDERTVLGRFGQPDEISPIVVLLCSEKASFCIGSVIPVEGGQARHYFQKVDDN
ncbi:MAG: SDR family NAD(P)-dependent oxidoreductase [Methylophilaceae bacterium]|nr:SDR family NAD(P)-dependent oxidoreductase [Methylophilaceae bacterium]